MFELAQTTLGPFERLGGSVALGFEASELLALVTVLVASLLGFMLPLVSAVFEFGPLAHDRLTLLDYGGEGIEVMLIGSDQGTGDVIGEGKTRACGVGPTPDRR